MPYKKRVYKKRVIKKPVTVKQVKKLITSSQEMKFHDKEFGSTVSTAGTVFAISDIAQGQSDITRIGDQLTVKHIDIRGVAAFTAAADTFNFVRLILVKWNELGVPTVPDILQTVGISSYLSHYVMDTMRMKRFTILHDKTYSVVLNEQIAHWRIKKNVNIKVSYNLATTNSSKGLFMILLSDSNVSLHPYVGFVSRVLYNDS